MKTLILLILACAAMAAQELTITLRDATGQSSTRTLSGPAVVAGLEVLEQYRLDQCVEPIRAPGGCIRLKYSSTLDVIRGLIVDAVLALSDRYPTTATAAIRQRKAQAEAELAAAKAALEASVRQ